MCKRRNSGRPEAHVLAMVAIAIVGGTAAVGIYAATFTSPTCDQLPPDEQWIKCFRADYPARITYAPDSGFACVCPIGSGLSDGGDR